MFLFWRDKSVLPEMREIILAHLTFCFHSRLRFAQRCIFYILSNSLFKVKIKV